MKSLVLTSNILAFKYKDGVIIATDNKGSYGYTAKYTTLTRTFKLTAHCLISYSGEYSDIQNLHKLLKYELMKDTLTVKPRGIHSMVQRILYTCRSRLQPLNVFTVVGGMENGEPFVGAVNNIGNFYTTDVVSNGLGAYIATPYLRSLIENKSVCREEAVKIMTDAMRLMCYRGCNVGDTYNVGIVESEMCEVREPVNVETDWEVARSIGE